MKKMQHLQLKPESIIIIFHNFPVRDERNTDM
jgi:hypothetical protein